MSSIMDTLEPENLRKGSELLCPALFHNPNPKPFERVFSNEEYVLLKL